MNPLAVIQMIIAVFNALKAVHESEAGKSAEAAIEEVIHHLTPGKPNSPVLSGSFSGP